MAEQKGRKASNNDKDDDAIRAGVSAEQEKEARKDAKEDFKEEVTTQHEADLDARDEEDPELLKELPEDGAVVPVQEELAATAVSDTAPYARVIEDQFTGQGGTFVIDAESGERKRSYVAVRDPKNPDKIRGYRPAV